MFHRAEVKEVETATGRARVIFRDHDDMVSHWLHIMSQKTMSDKAYWLPDVGEQVVVLMDKHWEDGIILGAIYSDTDTPPVDSQDKAHYAFMNGASFEYDRAENICTVILPEEGILNVTAPAGATMHVNGGFTVNAVEGGVMIDASDGGVTVNASSGGVTIDASSGGVSITGDVSVDGDISASGDVADNRSTMQDMRDTYNGHGHGANGAAPPAAQM